MKLDNLFFIIFGAIVLYMIYQVISKGGLKGAVFGSKISKTIGEIKLKEGGLSSQVLRVHLLENGDVGIEQTAKAFFGFSVTGFTLTQQQSEDLVMFLKNTK
jgi:hypothetical protein